MHVHKIFRVFHDFISSMNIYNSIYCILRGKIIGFNRSVTTKLVVIKLVG